MAPTAKPIVFHYGPSIYSHRVLWYLWLRGIAYDECIQPPIIPRPDLVSIGVGYRKMPLLAIGQDVYCDSRLIISKLENLYPGSNLAPSTPAEAGTGKLFESYTIDGGIFANAVKLIPYWTDESLLKNTAFLDDRQKLMGGRRMTREAMEAGRPDGLQHMRQAFELLETTFLADGRNWVLGTRGPTVADIDAVWPFEWLIVDQNMRDSLPEKFVNEKIYPKVYAWVRRFMSAVEERKKSCPKPTRLDGQTMASSTRSAGTPSDLIGIISDDPLDLKEGDDVEVFPSDYGHTGKSFGALVGLSVNEMVIRNKHGYHVHFPRWNFSIKKAALSPALPLRSVQPSKRLPKMRMLYHPFSPFARKATVLVHELGFAQHIEFQKVVICPVPFPGWSDNNEDVAAYNPMAKIPCLISDDVPGGIYDSDVICEYLEELASVVHTKDSRYWQLHALHACADGIMDASVLMTYEVRIRKERGLFFDEWMKGQQEKIFRGLDRLEVAAKSGILSEQPKAGPASADEVTIAVAAALVGHTAYLEIAERPETPHLDRWVAKWAQRQSFVDTPPGPEDWVFESKSKNESKI